jgi:hypothetical protein
MGKPSLFLINLLKHKKDLVFIWFVQLNCPLIIIIFLSPGNLYIRILIRRLLLMEIEHQTKLTASELSLLWTSYLNDSMALCGIKHFLAN